METGVQFEREGGKVRVKYAIPSQNLFRQITSNAVSIGMKVNAAKTNLVAVSDALSFKAESYIEDVDGTVLRTGGGMKVLGFHLSDRPTVGSHIEALNKRLRARLWVLRHLRESGFSEEELVRVYKVVIRPVHDYLCVVYHPMMTDEHDERVERMQAQALKSIFGWKIPYAELRKRADVSTLWQRRVELCDKFAAKCAESQRFGQWFPLRGGARRSGRTAPEKYQEFFARCDRLKNSPLHYMRRRLNGKAGKQYGEQNRKYRD